MTLHFQLHQININANFYIGVLTYPTTLELITQPQKINKKQIIELFYQVGNIKKVQIHSFPSIHLIGYQRLLFCINIIW